MVWRNSSNSTSKNGPAKPGPNGRPPSSNGPSADRSLKPGQKLLWCAVYTRKSTDENLNTDFNSLDAQREYCQAFIKSREGEGWRVYPETYEDPGFSGGNMDRPALKKLLADVRAGKIHVVVCYKYDRLSRNTRDFLHILEIFDRNGAAFVSVTQPIDTTSSVGRLMRSILVDFAQFEREMIAERVRDKLAGMARKGKRTGGPPILGYDIDAEKKCLLVNADEVKRVIEMFTTYTATKSLCATAKSLNAKGYRMKRWVTREGNERGGASFNKATVFNLLRNRLYIGKIVHRGEAYPGEHSAIVPDDLFETVQALLSRNRDGRVHRAKPALTHNYILRGIVRCAACGSAMTPHTAHTRKGQDFFYYRCISVNKMDKTACPVRSVSAPAIEEHVIRRLQMLAENKDLLEKVINEARSMAVHDLPSKREERRMLDVERGRVAVVAKGLMAHLSQETPGSRRSEMIRAELDECIGREDELKAQLAILERQISTLEQREVDADVIRRNLGSFKELYGRMDPVEQKELIELLLHRVVYEQGERIGRERKGRITLELNVLPDLWGDAASGACDFVYRQRTLPD